MTNHIQMLPFMVLFVFVVAGCSELNKTNQATDSFNQESSSMTTDQWVGTWYGPENTFLEISGSGGQYQLIIQNLDSARTFQGFSAGNQIQFERDGLKEMIHATDGKKTGMKWLTEKSNCLTVRYGEGYCQN